MSTAIVLFGHGSRDPAWRRPIDAVAGRLATASPDALVRCAFLELTTPDLPATTAELAAAGVRRIRIVPMFLGVGRHAREDLPLIVDGLRAQYADIAFDLAPAVGEDERLLDLLADIARG